MKKRPHMPNLEELLNQISSELSKNDHNPIWISVIDLDYADGQMKLATETSKHCNFAVTCENLNGYYQFVKQFYGPADIPTFFQEKIYRTLGHQTPVWLDDIVIVTRGTEEEHTRKLNSVLSELENEGYRASKKKSNFYQKKRCDSGTHYHKTASDQTKKRDTISKLEPHKRQNTEIFPRCQTLYFAKFIPNLSKKNRQHETTTQERNKMGLNDGPNCGF